VAWQAIPILDLFDSARERFSDFRSPIGPSDSAVASYRLVFRPLSHCLVLDLFYRRRVVAHDLNKIVDQIKDVMNRSEDAQTLVEHKLVDPL